MEDLLLESLTEDKVTYRYYHEGGEKFGIVSLMHKTGKRIRDKPCQGERSVYAGQAWHRIDEYQKKRKFPEKALVMWY